MMTKTSSAKNLISKRKFTVKLRNEIDSIQFEYKNEKFTKNRAKVKICANAGKKSLDHDRNKISLLGRKEGQEE